jgi:hypothetical protein
LGALPFRRHGTLGHHAKDIFSNPTGDLIQVASAREDFTRHEREPLNVFLGVRQFGTGCRLRIEKLCVRHSLVLA